MTRPILASIDLQALKQNLTITGGGVNTISGLRSARIVGRIRRFGVAIRL